MPLNPTDYDQMKQDVIGTFDRAAPSYDQVGTKRFVHFGKLLIEQLNLPAGAHVLDIATGRGALLFPAAEKVGAGGQVIGIDLAPNMIAATRLEIERRGLNHAEVRLMDADHITFEPETFDFVLCGSALHLFDFERALPQYLNVLKSGGCFVASAPYNPPDAAEQARWQWLFDLTKAVFPPDFTPPPSWIAPRRLAKPELAEAALAQAGFIKVRTETHQATLYFRDEQDWWDWEWSQGSRFWVEGMSPDGLERFKRAAFEHLKPMKTAQGIPMLDGMLFVFGYKG